jgi:hypothetical protein
LEHTAFIHAIITVGEKENETKISFQSHGKRTSVLDVTTEEIQTEIQVVLCGKSRTPPGVIRN